MMDVNFRAKALEEVPGLCNEGDWVYGSLVSRDLHGATPYIIGMIEEAGDDYVVPEFWVPVDKETIGQGLNKADKKGNLIYEGDIVSCQCESYYEKFQALGVVKYNANNCEYFLQIKRDDGRPFRNTYIPMAVCCDIETLGNIHDDPEILEVE
ncbi:YopX family protein [Aminobacterium colombiense]